MIVLQEKKKNETKQMHLPYYTNWQNADLPLDGGTAVKL